MNLGFINGCLGKAMRSGDDTTTVRPSQKMDSTRAGESCRWQMVKNVLKCLKSGSKS